MSEKNLWERQENESNKAFQAFCIFRDLGAGRTLAAVAEKLRFNSALVEKLFLEKAAKAIQNIDFENISIKSLPSVVNAINIGVEIERTARELSLQKSEEKISSENIFVETLTKIWSDRKE